MAVSDSAQRGMPLLIASTAAFIADDPVDIVLTAGKGIAVETASGGYDYEDAGDKPVQTFKLINTSGDSNSPTSGDGRDAVRFSYMMIGMPDADIEVGDWWVDGDNRYAVTGILHRNGYEVKATVEAYGTEPNYG